MGKKTYKHPVKYTTESFIKRLTEIYGEKFTYDFVKYNGSHRNITLVCPTHGKFTTKACYAARGAAVCKKCSSIKKSLKSRIPFNIIIERIKNKHKNLIIKQNQPYKNTHTKIEIICPIHGTFKMTPNSLLNGQSCPKCSKEIASKKISRDINWLKRKCNEIYGDKYDLSKFVFKNTKTKGIVICGKHGEFNITPDKLIYSKQGCPICKSSHLENEVLMMLKNKNIKYEHKAHFEWLGLQHLDFYLPDYNVAIECQGIQHYKPIRFGGIDEEKATENLAYIKKLDYKKRILCEKNNVKLIYIKYNQNIDSFYKNVFCKVCT